MYFAEAPQSFVELNGVRICYRQWRLGGRDEEGLIFLHGFRAHSHWWDHIVPHFASAMRVAVMDFSGFGDSDWRKSYSARELAQEVLAVAAACGFSRVVLVAHSFGATIAAHACALQSGLMRRLVIVDARLMIHGLPEPSEAELSELGRLRLHSPLHASEDEIRARFRLVPPSSDVAPDLLDHVARRSYRRSENGFTWKFDPRFDPLLTDDCDRWAPPVADVAVDLIYGARSAVVSREVVSKVARHFPTCGPPIEIADCDHHIPLERPAALTAKLDEILGRR